jgi:hypothetical protein
MSQELEQAFGGAAPRPTAQRYAELEFLARSPIHATAEEILAAVNCRDRRASRPCLQGKTVRNYAVFRGVGRRCRKETCQ